MCSGSSITTRPTARRTASRSTSGCTCDDLPPGEIGAGDDLAPGEIGTCDGLPPGRILSSRRPDHLGRLEDRMSILGTRVVRTEDPRLLTAGGTYVDDLRLPGAAQVTFVRTPVAHALVTGIDV